MLKNYSETSLERLNNIKKKVLLLSKIEKKDIPKIKKKKKLLFNDPNNFLKLPNEMSFNFIIGKKFYATEQKIEKESPKHKGNSFLIKRMSRKRSIIPLSTDLRRAFESNKKISQIKEEQKSTSRKKRQDEILNIFSKLRKRLNNSESRKDKKIELSNEIPNFIKKYIKNKLNQQEKALKCREEYNKIFKNMEHNISQSMEKSSKSFHITNKNIELKRYETANLFKNSVNDYRQKIEKIKLFNKKTKNHLIIETPIRNWEMSLRRPRNFIGLRKGYLNISSDTKPVWIIATERCGVDEEKIVNPDINDFKSQSVLQQNYIRNPCKICSDRNTNSKLRKFNSLLIQGKKLIDLEEKQAEKLNGNIKILKYKYNKDSTKDLLLKMNCSLNKYLINKNDSFV